MTNKQIADSKLCVGVQRALSKLTSVELGAQLRPTLGHPSELDPLHTSHWSHLHYPSERRTALKPAQVPLPLAPMTVNNRVDRRRPVTGGHIVLQERKLEPATAEQSPRLKSGGKGKTTT
jgi:hypothetical protein